MAETVCNPFDMSTRIESVETRVNNKFSIKYSGKMICSVAAPSSGDTIVKARLLTDTESSFDLERANLMIKQ